MPAETQRARAKPRTVSRVLSELDAKIKIGRARELVPIPTHFDLLDRVLGGGVRPGDLILIGGTPGVGKTVVTLQWARNVALAGGTSLYVCYEHEEAQLLSRLLAMELGELPHSTDDVEMERLRLGIQEVAMGAGRSIYDVIDSEDAVRRAYERIETYAERLWLVKASGVRTGLTDIEDMILQRSKGETVIFLDYLQKIPIRPEPPNEAEKVTRVVETLKDMALTHEVPIVSIVAADKEGLKANRLRLHHLRGSSALMYECDVAVILNNKFDCVSKVHLAYDPVRAETFKDYTVFSLEKNRGGPNTVDLEFRKDFVYYRFDPVGGMVAEKLVDERFDPE